MNHLFCDVFEKSKSIQTLLEHIEKGRDTIFVTGVWGTLSAQLVTCLGRKQKKGGLVVVSSESEAKALVEDLKAFGQTVLYFPPRETFFFDVYAHSHQRIYDRIAVIESLVREDFSLVVTTIEALLIRLPEKKIWKKERLFFNVGQSINRLLTLEKLVNMGYERVDQVETAGHFSIRGGILDIYAPGMTPVRIELFDDEVDSVRLFDPETQLSVKTEKKIEIGPCREIILDKDNRKRFCDKLVERMDKIKDKTQKEALIEMESRLRKGDWAEGLERYTALIYEKNATLVDFLYKDAPIYISSPPRVKEKGERYKLDYQNRFESHFERGALFSEQFHNIFEQDRIVKDIKSHPVVLMDNLDKGVGGFQPQETVRIHSMEAPLFHGKREALVKELGQWKRRGYHVVLSVSSEKKEKRLQEELRRYDIEATCHKPFEDTNLPGTLSICAVNLNHGFLLRDIRYVVLTDRELSGVHKKTRKKRTKPSRPIKSFNELSVGDYVVHEAHGIGKYVGIDQLSVDGQKKDYMKITYSGDDVLYIPVENMDLIQKYIGKENQSTKLSKLGGVEWKRAKARAQKSIEDMTEDLLKLYASRKGAVGYAYGPDTEWQRQFEEMFPYEETPDQIRCIEEIKADMEKPLPMERLLCGDVGYGKTEVAIRAVFKAVMDSKQAVFLVPTTLLAQQHYDRLKARFSKFPVKVEMLSRFKSAGEQKKIIENLRTGILDVVIGTHRVLSDDVKYKDLGLLIIDEEQRFGVKHKEKIKRLKAEVDVLSLTATPIPRTLHMSMVGIRDMSLIEDPPEDRYPVQTYVTAYDENLVAEAIEREVDRGGQVFFVHNRVKDIDLITARLQRLVPDVRVRSAHGQMPEAALEQIMIEFLDHDFDVLVCTTIIETGLDISNVNTMIINNSDKMGLAQLYQLRGRVGRSNRTAYAYLMYSRDKVLSEAAEKRLRAVKTFTELGSGFRIAMRDLEIRGTGHILGAAQSGHMATVGYEMYVKMLEKKVRQIRGQTTLHEPETTVEYNISAYIPEEYVTNPQHKIELYKRISSIRNKEDAFEIEVEIEDRYGTLPVVVYNLIHVAYLKALGMAAGVHLISEDLSGVRFEWNHATDLKPETIILATQTFGQHIQVHAGNVPRIKYKFLRKGQSREKQLASVLKFMERIVHFQKGEYKV